MCFPSVLSNLIPSESRSILDRALTLEILCTNNKVGLQIISSSFSMNIKNNH